MELHAMALAKSHLQGLGWRVRDMSATHPYDFECTQGEQQMIVEVKGTTSIGDEVAVTFNEVEVQRTRYPNNALIVVHSVNLLRSSEAPRAHGGKLLMHAPWKIEDSQLRPIAFRCERANDQHTAAETSAAAVGLNQGV